MGDEEHQKEIKSQIQAKARKGVVQAESGLLDLQEQLKRPFYRRLLDGDLLPECLYSRLVDRRNKKRTRGRQRKAQQPMETVIREKTILKIGSPLALGFGEAGAEIIGQNMKRGDAGVYTMIPGRKVDAIFGFCDIRNFADATEILQDQVMLCANQIADVVHSCIDAFSGAPNKNIGDAFLLV